MAPRSLASLSSPDGMPAASELNFVSISASTNFSGSRTPRDSSDRIASRRSSASVDLSRAASTCGSDGSSFAARLRLRRGAASNDEIVPSFMTKDPGECSRHSLTTPRRLSAGSRDTTAARTADTPPGLWLPRPVMISTSLARLIWRSRNHASARYRASAAVGSDSRKFRMFLTPNSASSNAFRTGRSEPLLDRILQYVSVEPFLRSHMSDCGERRRHVDYSSEFRIATGFDLVAVENYRHMRI